MTERPLPPSDEAARRLRLARDVFSPSPSARERVWAGLAARGAALSEAAALPPTANSAPRVAAQRNSVPPGALTFAKSGALVAVGFALGVWFSGSRSEAPAALTPAVTAVAAPLSASAPPGASTEPAPAAEPYGALAPPVAARQFASDQAGRANPPSPPARSAVSSRATGSSRHASSSVSAEELALLQRAERAIRASDGELARSFLAELEVRFPKTAWREEREAIAVLAACAEQEPEAAGNARSFLARHPSTVYFDRIGSMCQLGLNGSPRAAH